MKDAGALPPHPHKENFLKEVLLDLSRTLIGEKLRFSRRIASRREPRGKAPRLPAAMGGIGASLREAPIPPILTRAFP